MKIIANIDCQYKFRQLTRANAKFMSLEKVTDIIVEQLGVNADQVKPEAKLVEDLGADSLDAVELVMAIEEEFGLEVPDEEAEKLQSVGDILTYVEKNS